jgi:hypothetical protein
LLYSQNIASLYLSHPSHALLKWSCIPKAAIIVEKEGVGRIVLQIQNRKETQKYGEDKSHDLIIG